MSWVAFGVKAKTVYMGKDGVCFVKLKWFGIEEWTTDSDALRTLGKHKHSEFLLVKRVPCFRHDGVFKPCRKFFSLARKNVTFLYKECQFSKLMINELVLINPQVSLLKVYTFQATTVFPSAV